MKNKVKSSRNTRRQANEAAWGVNLTQGGFAQSGLTQKRLNAQQAKKEQWNQSNGLNTFTLTKSQQELQQKILHNDLVFCFGSAGSGKTTAALYTFCKEYIQDSTKQIYIVRTPVESGLDKIGALPNDYNAKVEPHFASAKMILEKMLTKGKVENDLGNRIHFKIPNYMLGSTLDEALILVDETQMIPPLILKLILERTGKDSKVVVAGDNSQLYTDSKGRNALRDAIPRFFDVEREITSDGEQDVYVSKFPHIALHKFDVEDVQRSALTKSVIMAYGSEV